MTGAAIDAPFSTAVDYLAAGWVPLWFEPRTKFPPPSGCTGGNPDPNAELIEKWSTEPEGNIGLRLPANVVGIDVDQYGDKTGGNTLADLEAKLGPLPPTVISTSRDGVSGIRFFRVPVGLKWPTQAGRDIEIVRHGHRYAIVWPSIHPDTGCVYTWRGLAPGQVPTVADLAEMPDSWITYLTAGEHDDSGDLLDEDKVSELLTEGEPCRVTSNAIAGYRERVNAGDSHHYAMIATAMAIVRAGEQGHDGVISALQTLYDQFSAEANRANGDEWPEFRRGVDTAVAKVLADPSEGPRGCCRLTVIKVPDSDSDFWESRLTLKTIRRYAKARLMPPWGVLGGVLAQVVASTPPTVTLPPILGGRASLNLFLAFVGASGDGKGGSMAVAREAIEIPSHYRAETILPGSGEGLVGVYAINEKSEGGWNRRMLRDRAIVDVPEVDALAALGAGRNGATLMPFLRSAWSAEPIGRTNATPERNVSIDEHSYRLVMTVGVQPERADVLINDTAGTAQRFVWLPMIDPNPTDIDDPAAIRWLPPSGARGSDHVQRLQRDREIEVCEVARIEVREARKRRLRGVGNTLDGQAMLSKLKVAAALAILEGRYEILDEDWRLAGIVMERSNATRAAIQDELSQRAAHASKARGKMTGVQTVEAEETAAEIKTTAAATAIKARLDNGEWQSRSQLRGSLKATHRPFFDDAMAALETAGDVEERQIATDRADRQGVEYRKRR
jgi:Bifunctional DNA primase/polymerase, N-terminal